MVLCWFCLRFRAMMQAAMMSPRRRAAPNKDPMTMPAIAPPDSLEPEPPAAPPVVDPVGATVVVVVNRGGMVVVVGSFTPTQRASTSEFTQQESVEFWELAAQKAQRPGRLEAKPHSSGSLSTAGVHLPVKALAECWHRSESDRIWSFALLPGLPQKSGVEIMSCSLMANWAWRWSAFTSTKYD